MSRQPILDAIRKNKPEAIEAPEPMEYLHTDDHLVANFIASVEKAGGKVIQLQQVSESKTVLKEYFPQLRKQADFVNFPQHQHLELLQDAANIELAVLRGRLGVAENGAIWLPASDCIQRSLPFIAHHLALVLDSNKLVPTMHQAYQQIDTTQEGFGVFIAGPSKTADIEQSLVIGAHGAKSLLVLLTGCST